MCHTPMFVRNPDQFSDLDPQSSEICHRIGTLMTGNDTTCLPQAEVTTILGSTLNLSPSQIQQSLGILANQQLITIIDGDIYADNLFPNE